MTSSPIPGERPALAVSRARVRTIRGSFPTAASDARRTWTERVGVVLELVSADGTLGRGEASPLPGFSPEPLDDVRAALAALDPSELPVIQDGIPIDAQLRHVIGHIPLSLPSARFALETALLDLASKRSRCPSWTLLAPDGIARTAHLAALVTEAEIGPALVEARAALERGIRTIKVKIGRPGARAAELELVREMRSELGPAVAIRVDANGALSPSELPATLEALAALDVELVEDPARVDALVALRSTPVPIALDELLVGDGSDERLRRVGDRGLLGAVVLKPTAIGGVLRALELARRARAFQARAIASHCYEGPIGFGALAALAVVLPEPRSAAGLDRHGGLDALGPGPLPGLGPASIVPWDEPAPGEER